MARARNIKPGFARNEDLAECSAWARLCFALLPTIADREGRLEDRPKRIKGDLFPFDSIEVEPLLVELDTHGLIARYAVEGAKLIQILAFSKHQNPHHKEPESRLPPPTSLRLDADGKWVKPETLTSCDAQKTQDKPEASPGLDPPTVDLAGGVNRAESKPLNPDTGEKKARKRAVVVDVPLDSLLEAGFDAETAADFIAHKQRVKAPLTPRAWTDHLREAGKAGMTPQAAAEKVMAKGWKGFDASYVAGRVARPGLDAPLFDASEVR